MAFKHMKMNIEIVQATKKEIYRVRDMYETGLQEALNRTFNNQ